MTAQRESMKLKIRDVSGWTMFVFGVLALLLGLVGLIRPEALLSLLGFETLSRAARVSGDYTIVYMTAASMASFNLGAYYILAAVNDVKKFYMWTVPLRVVTFTVFTLAVVFGYAPLRFLGVGLWELVGSLSTGIALYFEQRAQKAAQIG
jgi:Na+-driven multidrug efflux pump